MVLELIVAISFIGLLLYVVFGGADYGAGILETFLGKESEKFISKSIAPIWEANHVWLILLVVVAFNAFSEIFWAVSINLHIPLTLTLIGIILRGSAFTFRHYNPSEKGNWFHTIVFRISSFITPFFLGMTFGAMLSGGITISNEVPFSEKYIAPWLHPFPMMMGVFFLALCAYLAGVFFSQETIPGLKKKAIKLSHRLHIFTLITGLILFFVPTHTGTTLFSLFGKHPLEYVAILVVGILTVLVILYTNKRDPLARVFTGAQIFFILLSGLNLFAPTLLVTKEKNLGIYNASSSEVVLIPLLVALIIGVVSIFPMLFYLYKIFKLNDDKLPE